MADLLEFHADKFTFRVATDRLYSPEGIWVRTEAPNRVRVGISDYAQQHDGDIAFITVRSPGTLIEMGEEFAELETVKVTHGLPSPVQGTLIEVNEALESTPELVNTRPFDEGWVAVLETSNWEQDRARLLEPQAYLAVMQSRIDAELLEQ